MDLVHRLDWIVQNKPGKLGPDRKVKCKKECESRRIEVPGAEHGSWRTATATFPMDRFKLSSDCLAGGPWNLESRYKWLSRSEAHKEVSPYFVKGLIEDASNYRCASVSGYTRDILRGHAPTLSY